MLNKGVTLRGIEVFEALAQTGSVAQAADTLGLSQPTVSQQMAKLEAAVGTPLIDHGRRPMRLTPAGQLFMRRVGAALSELRHGQSEVTLMDLAKLRDLSLGIIDDFDDDLTPRLATILADSMSECRFRMITAGSNELAAAMQAKALHIAISAQGDAALSEVTEYPLARDPFIIVTPRGVEAPAADLLAGTMPLPFLHYAAEQLIARQIALQLSQAHVHLPKRFEIGSHLALMSMVARGIGWAITTPLGYMRAARFQEDMRVIALPMSDAARQISLFAGADWSGPIPRDIAETMRRLMQTHIIDPATRQLPWLSGQFHLIGESE
ncbi:MAG: LysR family transcriptional regulator [Pseudomonadota bacterium]